MSYFIVSSGRTKIASHARILHQVKNNSVSDAQKYVKLVGLGSGTASVGSSGNQYIE